MSRRPVLAIFTLSGAAGLVYQVIWARQLGLVFGNTTASVTIVLAAFMAGLALGAEWAGRVLVRRANPLRVYAVLEAAIGLYALAFGPLVSGLETLYPHLLSDTASPVVLTLVRSVVAFGLVLLPTTCMGATLPLTTEYLHRLALAHTDWNAGRLYAANTLGSALGSVASGFVLIELVGIANTTRIAAGFNVVVGLLGWWLARGLAPASTPATPAAPAAGQRTLLLLFAITGALALAGEVLWTRALTLLLGSSTYAFSGILVVYLVGIAFGSWVAAGMVRRLAAPERFIPLAILGAGAWHAFAVTLFAPLHALVLGLLAATLQPMSPAQFYARAVATLVAVLGVMVPPAALSGALFPLVTRLLEGDAGDRGAPIARAYTWNTVGAIVGSLVGGFAIAPFFVHFHAIDVLALCFLGAALCALGVIGWRAFPIVTGVTVVGALAVTALSVQRLQRPDAFVTLYRQRRPAYEVRSHEPGLQGITTVAWDRGKPEQSAQLLVNGVGMTVKAFATKAMAHLPIIAHGAAEDVLVICFGMGTTFRSALTHGGRVDVVELTPGVFGAFDAFYADAAEVRQNPRGRMIVNDGRNFLLLTDKRYDVITLDPPPPIDAAGVSTLYTREFLELMRAHLEPGGIVAHWLPPLGRGGGLSDIGVLDMLAATFLDVFPHVRVLVSQPFMNRSGFHLLGSDAPIALDPERLTRALENPAVKRDMMEFGWDPLVPERFFFEVNLHRDLAAKKTLLTDDRPLLEFNLIRNLRLGLAPAMIRVAP